MLKVHHQDLTKKITKICSEQLKTNNNLNIEKLINEKFITEVIYNGISTINELSEELIESFDKIINEIYNNNQDKNDLFYKYINMFIQIIQRNKIDWLDNVIEDFTNNFLKTNEELNNNQELKKQIKKEMLEYKKKFIKDCKSILEEFIKEHIKEISKLINSTNFKEIIFDEYKKYSEIILLSNYKLIEENGKYYIQEIKQEKEQKSSSEELKQEEKIEMYLTRKYLSSKDNKLKFIIVKEESTTNKKYGFMNLKTNRTIVVHKDTEKQGFEKINLTSLDDNSIITIYKTDGNYSFEYNLKPLSNDKPKGIKIVLSEIRQKYRGIFNKVFKDPDFKPIIEKIELYNQIIKKKKNLKTLPSNNSNISKEDEETKKKN